MSTKRTMSEEAVGVKKVKKICYVCRQEGHFAPQCTRAEKPDRCRIPLGKSIYVTANEFRGELYVHIRHYDEIDTKLVPTKKGIALTLQRWNNLKNGMKDIEEAVLSYDEAKNDVKFGLHLGGNCMVSVTRGFPCVDMRKFYSVYDDEGKSSQAPTRRGIAIGFAQFHKLKDVMNEVDKRVPELETVIPCMMSEDHQNQLGMLRCSECNPGDCINW